MGAYLINMRANHKHGGLPDQYESALKTWGPTWSIGEPITIMGAYLINMRANHNHGGLPDQYESQSQTWGPT
ncbi:hypothetical protein DPMN_151247 [Dreissena polymorpha]|uniref:Uncharacterized protein n=1 Tax=Dreissena polymorpha TaxID=45954 RepID=A0A9D4J744_DREPO|nr:hypothetical protein DPMN_151247 [Dreissena polymorpha]